MIRCFLGLLTFTLKNINIMILSLPQKFLKSICFGAIVLLTASNSFAQSYNIDDYDGQTISVPTASNVYFYDSGGPGSGGATRYLQYEDYTITFSSENGQPLLFTFTQFTTRNNQDYLYVYDGPSTSSDLIGAYTGTNSPGTIIPSSQDITFRFVSQNNRRDGWAATITSMDLSEPDVETCSGTFTDKQLGGDYTQNQYYKVTYRSNEIGKNLLFNFTDFNLGTNDRLIALDGDSISAPVIGTYTGNGSPGTVISTNDALTFVFIANDDASVGRGWNANVSCFNIKTFYSYNDVYTWDDYRAWTLDPSGSIPNNPANEYPTALDKAVILNGKTIVVDNNGNSVTQLDIREGGVLNVQGTNGHNFGTIIGKGRMRSSTGELPAGVYTLFTQASGGTIELFGVITGAPTLSETTFNNLEINANSNQTVVIGNTTQINGNLLVSGGTLNINSAAGTSITVEGNINVNSGATFGLGNANNNNRALFVKGDFENEGTVTFTNRTTAGYTANPGRSVDLVFNNPTQNQAFTCNGPTTLNRLIVDKGTDDTYMLDVNASATANFRLFGRNDSDYNFPAEPPDLLNQKALEIYAGTLRLGSNISIPRLLTTPNTNSQFAFVIDQDAALILDGSTVNVSTQTDNSTIIVYGKLKVMGNSTFTSLGRQGIILREYGVVEVEGNPTINTTAFRTSSRTVDGAHRGTLTMSGGTLTITGNNFATSHPAFALPFPDNTLQLSGGTINVERGSYYNFGWPTFLEDTEESWLVSSNPENISITGGTVNIYANGHNARINSTAPFYNLNLISNSGNTISIEPVTEEQQDETVTVPAAPRRPLVVLNNLTVNSNTTFNPQGMDVTVGRNYTLNGAYTPGSNTTFFNAFGIQTFDNAGTINDGGLYNLTLNNSSNLILTNSLNVRSNLTINSQTTLRDGGNTINVAGNITNSGTHQSATGGSLILNGDGAQTIDGNGLGEFGNLSLNKATGSTTTNADFMVNGNLRLGGTAAVLSIGSNKLELSEDSYIYNALTGTASARTDFDNTRMVETNGAQSDLGIVKQWDAVGSFTYPTGANGKYTPSVIQIDANPTVWGSLSVNPVNNIHPLATSTNMLNYYWNVRRDEMLGIPSGSLRLYFYFDEADVVGNEDFYIPAYYFPVSWTFFNDPNLITNLTNEIRFEDIPDPRGHFTAGEPDAFGEVTTYYSNVANGSWDELSSWSYNAAGTEPVTELPGENSPVIIQGGHTINILTDNKLVGSLTIEEDAVLDIGITTGHFFGLVHESTVSGTGTLRISSDQPTAVFPGGDFGDFLGDEGGTVEYYTIGTQDYIMPSGDITTITLLNEGFEGGFPPGGWTVSSFPNDEGGSQWERSTSQSVSGNASAMHTPSTYNIWFWTFYHYHNDMLITPPLNFSDAGSYQLSFWRFNSNANNYEYQGVWISTTNSDPSSFSELQELSQGIENTWVEHTIDLTDYAGNNTIYLAFVYQGEDVDDVYIDDVTITKSFGTSRYHNLIINPDAIRTITLPGINVTTTGNVTVKGSGTAATSNSLSAMLSVGDSLNVIENSTLRIDNTTTFSLEQNGAATIGENATVTVNTAGANAREHSLTFYENVANNGTLNLNPGSSKYANLYFKGTTNQEFSGIGTTNLNMVYVDKGSSQVPLVNVTADEFTMNTGLGQALFIQNGTIRFSGTSLNLTLTTNSPFSIPATGCLSVNGSIVTIGSAADNSADLQLVGKLEVMDGTMNIGAAGNNTHNDIEYATAGSPEVAVSGGTLNVNGQIRRSTTIQTGNLTYRQSGGDVFIYGKNRDANQIKRALLEVLNDGRFLSIGGNLHLVQGVGSGESSNTFGELYLDPASSTVTGGTIHTGTSQTNAATNWFNLYLGSPIYNLTIDGETTAKNARLRTFEATLNGSLYIDGPEASVFYANNINLNIAGDFISRSGNRYGSYNRGSDTQQTTFNGINQTVYKNDELTSPGGGLFLGSVVVNQQSGGQLILENYEFWSRGDLHLLSGSIIQNNGSNFLVMKDVYIKDGFSITSNSNGRLTFYNSSISQNIYSEGLPSLGRVVIFYNNGVKLNGNLQINNRLDFPSSGGSGTLNIGNNYLVFVDTAIIGTGSNAPGPGRYILTNGALADKGVTKEFTSAGGSFTYPIGSGGKYTPVTMDVTNTGGVEGSITVKPIDDHHPSCTNAAEDELQYFWNVSSTGFSNPTVSHSYTYDESDITLVENNYVNARYYDFTWTSQTEPMDYGNNQILFTDANFIDGEYTAGYVDNFGTVHKYYSASNGLWNVAGSWVLDSPTGPPATVAPKGNPVFILSPHTITTNQNGAYAGSVDIETGARLDVGSTSEHNIGHVSGGGTIALTSQGGSSFLFPGGDFTDFMATTGSTVEYSGAGTLPATITTYQNVTFLGNNTRTIPAIDMLVRGNLRIENGTLSNASFNRTIRVEGNWVDLVAGGFNPGTGTVIFQGINEQTLTASGGAAETFYNLQINKTAGNLTLNNAATVNRVLTLSSGIVNTTATNLLTVNYGVSGAVVGGSSTAYVNGPLRRLVNNSSSANFPVGKDGRFGNLHIFGTTTSGSQYWTCEYFNTIPTDNTNLAAPLQLISNNEYWTLQGVNGASANVRLRWDDQSAIVPAGALDRQKLRVAQYIPPWTKVGETVNDVSQTQGTVETSTPVTFDGSAEEFTLAIEQTASAEITSGDVSACNDGSTFAVTYSVAGDAPLRVVINVEHTTGTTSTYFQNDLAEGEHTIEFTYAELFAIAGDGAYTVTIEEVYDVNDLAGIVLGTGVTLTALPTPNPIISGPTSVMTESVTTYSVAAVAGNTYSWSVDDLGAIITANDQNTINIEWGTSTGTATITLSQTSPASCTTIVTYEVDVRDWPVIIGDFSVCANSTEVYESKEVAGHDYLWVVQGGTIQESPPYGYQITVVWSSQTAGRVTLTQGPSGDQVTIFEDVSINPSPTAILTVDGSVDLCDGDAVTLQFGHSGGGISPTYELLLDGATYQPYEDEPLPKPNPFTTDPLIWEGTNANKEYTFGLRVTNTTTGCSSTWVEEVINVWKTPETGPQYHIPNTHGD